MRTSYESVSMVMVMTVVFATGCVHAPSTTVRTPSSRISLPPSDLEAPAAPLKNRSLVENAIDYQSESQGLMVVELDEVGDEINPRPQTSLITSDQRSSDSVAQAADDVEPVLLTSIADSKRQPLTSAAQQSILAGNVAAQLIDSKADADPNTSDVVPAGFHMFRKEPSLQPECMDLGLGSISSIIDPCGMKYLAPYLDRVPQYDEPTNLSRSHEAAQPYEVDPSYANSPGCPPPAWWEIEITHQARPESTPLRLDIESILVRTLAHSKYLQGLADLPLIREKSTLEARAAFDVTTFVESRFTRPSEPVGNQLTVGPGGSQRLRENDFSTSAGIARKTLRGARVELAQEVGLFNNNSTFIDPRHQGNSRLTLNITQPLMSGSGKAYNSSLIVLAQMDQRVAWDEVSEQLQDYLVEVTETYWQLYLERARMKQKTRHLERGQAILVELEHRRELDAVENQIARARAAVQSRRSELIRAKTLVRNTESRLRGLINDPQLYGSTIEVVPAEIPHCTPLNLTLQDAMSQALQSRSEIDKAIQKVRAAGVRLRVAKNELLPILDVVMETHLSGLRGQNDIGRAWVDQFSVGEPSYSAGIRYEIPLNNRMAKNRHDRRRIEMRQAISQFEFHVEELMSEVEIAVREVDTSYQEMLSRYEAMVANEVDLEYFHKRWELVPGDNRSASFLLEDILDAQDRVAAEESNFAQTQINYAMSVVNLKRALGILLQSEEIETERACVSGLEQYIFSKVQSVQSVDESSWDMHSASDADVMMEQIPRYEATPEIEIPFPPQSVPIEELQVEPIEVEPVFPESLEMTAPKIGPIEASPLQGASLVPASIESATAMIDSEMIQAAATGELSEPQPQLADSKFNPIEAPVKVKSVDYLWDTRPR